MFSIHRYIEKRKANSSLMRLNAYGMCLILMFCCSTFAQPDKTDTNRNHRTNSMDMSRDASLSYVEKRDELYVHSDRMKFARSGPVSAGQNVALFKPVIIKTNGKEDPYECSMQEPQDITDGSIDYKPVSWCESDGSIGFINDTYDEPMQITVTINLLGIYDITAIRYNSGNVQRAETWTADKMSTPFGECTCISGNPYEGVWTEQVGQARATTVDINFYKTRTSWETDWLFIGEIEIYGTLRNECRIPYLPSVNSYSVNNTSCVLTWEMFEKTFGSSAVERGGVPLPSAQQFYDRIYSTSSLPGSCFGLAVSSLLACFHDVDQSYVTPFDISKYNSLHQISTINNIISELPNRLAESIAYYHGVCKSREIERCAALSPNDALHQMCLKLLNNERFVLGVCKLSSGMHVVLPYHLTANFNDPHEIVLKIYDPTYPGDNTRTIIFFPEENRWVFDSALGSWQGEWSGNPQCFLCILELDWMTQRCTLPIPAQEQSNEIMVVANNSFYLLSDCEGNEIRYENGSYINNIEGIKPLYNFGNSPKTAIYGFIVPRKPESLEFVSRSDSLLFAYDIYANGSVVSFHGTKTSSQDREKIKFDNRASKYSFSSEGTNNEISLSCSIEKQNGYDTVDILKLVNNPTAQLDLYPSEMNGFKLANKGEIKTYDVNWKHVGSDSYDIRYIQVTLEANSSHIFQFADTLKQQDACILIDQNDDGAVDTKITLSPAATLIKADDSQLTCQKLSMDNYPNPFNSSSIIIYELPKEGKVRLQILNLNGQLVNTLIDEFQTKGDHTVTWDGRDASGYMVPSGQYFYILDQGENSVVKKVLYIR